MIMNNSHITFSNSVLQHCRDVMVACKMSPYL